MAKASLMKLKEFFGVSNTELIAFKKADPEGLTQLQEGLGDGSMTY